MSINHKAIVRGGGTVSVQDWPTSIPNENEILVSPVYAGLCGTDIQILRGLRSDPSPVIGHEGVARITAVGSSISARLEVGMLVCINPTHRNDPSFLLGHNVEGLMQENVLIKGSAVNDGLVLPLAENHNHEISTLLEPLAVVRYALSLLADHLPTCLVVFGDGVIGHCSVRSAREILGDQIRIVHIHHTQQGLDWSREHKIAGVYCVLNDDDAIDMLSSLPEQERIAVLLATPRNATLQCLKTAICHLQGELIIDLLGGLPENTSTELLPGINLSQIRAANCAGSPQPAKSFSAITSTGKPVCLLGHRGVANRHLRDSANELAENPLRYRELITHVVDMDEATDIMRQLSTSSERLVDGRRLIKLAVKFTPNNAHKEL